MEYQNGWLSRDCDKNFLPGSPKILSGINDLIFIFNAIIKLHTGDSDAIIVFILMVSSMPFNLYVLFFKDFYFSFATASFLKNHIYFQGI